MRLLVVTEKCGPELAARDGGARLIASLQRAFGDDLAIAQFGRRADAAARWHHPYPVTGGDRFSRRLANASFVADRVREMAPGFTDVAFVHVSMQFAVGADSLPGVRTWTLPMFLTPSYVASGEVVPAAYTEAEQRVLASTGRIITPSHLERRQMSDEYGVPGERVRVVPRGVESGLFPPLVRSLRGAPLLCSVGSIKRQKNTVGLVRLFAGVRARHPDARLRVIGGVQDEPYAAEVRAEIRRLDLDDCVELVGYLPPSALSGALAEAHLHLSRSACETFGRAIFETLAAGIPNVARAQHNAAAEFLARVPYARFEDDDTRALDAIDELLADLPRLSAMAGEVGALFDDEALGQTLAAELDDRDVIAVSDYDGTLFHKHDSDRTRRSVAAFRRFPARIVCSARPVADLVAALDDHGLEADWIVGCSGGVVADGRGRVLWSTPLDPRDIAALEAHLPTSKRIHCGNEVVQLSADADSLPPLPGYRVETYQGTAFISRWEASKLRAVHRLLRHLDWRGRVRAFGDGPYDEELLAYFDGTLIRGASSPVHPRQATEIVHA
ncbi:MAG: glycosyltransferase [Deltaproteobacteria bacterium]|jgi:glycosyltransferase involved in cell wall biosynthesis|nr:glycosyltransferase [Deltaproteobacteria bacterium]